MYYYDKFHMHRLNRSHFIKNKKIEQKSMKKPAEKWAWSIILKIRFTYNTVILLCITMTNFTCIG